MRKVSWLVGVVLVSACCASADSLPLPNKGFEAFRPFTSAYAQANDGAMEVQEPLSELTRMQPQDTAISSRQLLNAATSEDVSLQPVDQPTGDFLSPLLSVPEPNTLALVILPLVLAAGISAWGKRVGNT